MAEIQTEWALVFKTEELDAGMQHVKDVSNDTTKSIGEGWNTTGTAAVDALKKLLAQSEETHGRTKEQVEKASQAVDLLGDALGIKVPAALQKMAAESEVAGPIMESAFPSIGRGRPGQHDCGHSREDRRLDQFAAGAVGRGKKCDQCPGQ